MWICPECRALHRTKRAICPRDGFGLVPVQANLSKAKYPLLNQVVDDRYRLIAGLGQGGLGTVYLAIHERLDQLFAIKFLDLETVGIEADAGQREEYRSDFMDEARVASKVQHDSVVRVTDFGESQGLPYLVMEFVAGPSLLSMLGERGRFHVDEAINIAWSIAEALNSFHERKLIHRDLKPANVILDPRGGQLTLVDLGLVKDISGYGGKASTHPMALRGTPGYLAPEQVPSWVLSGVTMTPTKKKGLVDARVDLYALGVMLYEMVAGVSPYPEGSNTQIIVYACTKDPLPLSGVEPPIEMPAALEKLIYDTMSRDPERRPKNAHEFIERLKAVTGGERPESWPTIIMRDSRSTLQGVLPERAASINDEPSILDVFGEDSVASPPPPVAFDEEQTIEANTDSFDGMIVDSISGVSAVNNIDSRSRYQTAALTPKPSGQKYQTGSSMALPEHDASGAASESLSSTKEWSRPGNIESEDAVRARMSVSGVEHLRPPSTSQAPSNSTSEGQGFKIGFFVMLSLLIIVLGIGVFQSFQSGQAVKPQSVSSQNQNAQPSQSTGTSSPVNTSDKKVRSSKVVKDMGQDAQKTDPDMGVVPQQLKSQVKKEVSPDVVPPKPKRVIVKRAERATRKTKTVADPKKELRRVGQTKVPGVSRTKLKIAELKRRGDEAFGNRDWRGAETYYRKFLERAEEKHALRETVMTRLKYCESR